MNVPDTPSRLASKRPTLGAIVMPAKEEPNRHLALEAKVRELEIALFTANEKVEELNTQVEKANKKNKTLVAQTSELK